MSHLHNLLINFHLNFNFNLSSSSLPVNGKQGGKPDDGITVAVENISHFSFGIEFRRVRILTKCECKQNDLNHSEKTTRERERVKKGQLIKLN